MELKEYIKETLVQISEGVEAAQTEVRDCGGYTKGGPCPASSVYNFYRQ